MTDNMSLNDVTTLIINHTQRIDSLWGFYFVVSIGLVGFVISNTSEFRDSRNRIIIMIAFTLFAIFNFFAMLDEYNSRDKAFKLLNMIKVCDLYWESYRNSIEPGCKLLKLVGTIVGDILVLVAIWVVPQNSKHSNVS